MSKDGCKGIRRTARIPSTSGTESTLPSRIPIANVKGTIGDSGFTLNIVLTLPASLTSGEQQTIGNATGTDRNQQVDATLTANVNSSSFAFVGTIGSLDIVGRVSQPIRHGHMETAHASFSVTK
jgi:hypothetical protein